MLNVQDYRISYKYLVYLLYLWFLMQQLGHNYFISCLGFYRSFIYCVCGMILCNGLKCYFLDDFLLAFTKFAMGPNYLVPNDFHTQWKTTKLPVMFYCIYTGKITALLTHPFHPLLTWNPSVISCLPSHHPPYGCFPRPGRPSLPTCWSKWSGV